MIKNDESASVMVFMSLVGEFEMEWLNQEHDRNAKKSNKYKDKSKADLATE